MKDTVEYKLSDFLNEIVREDGVVLYHSLRGNLCMVDVKIWDILNEFKGGCYIKNVVDKYQNYAKEDIFTIIEIFYEKGFLVSCGENDEYGYYEKLLQERKENLSTAKQIGVIQLIVTNNCNFRCEYCFTNMIYSSEEREKLQKKVENKIMTPENAIKYIQTVIDKRLKNDEKTLSIQFFGGEPLANWNTCKAVMDYFKNGDEYGISISYGIVTNGSLITKEVAEYFKQYNVPVVVSFDSPKGDNRVTIDGKSAFDKIVQGISILRDNGNRIIFNSVFSKETFETFDLELIDFARENNVNEIGVLFDLDLEFYKQRTCEEIVDKLWEVYKYGQENGVLITGYWHMIFQKMFGENAMLAQGYKTCSATGCQLSIEPLGDVFACKGSSGYFGNINDFEALLSSEKYITYAMRFLDNAKECKGCELEHFCSGVCLGPLEKEYGRIDVVVKATCDIYKKIVRKLIYDVNVETLESYCIE